MSDCGWLSRLVRLRGGWRRGLPDPPWGITTVPDLLQDHFVAESVHVLPIAVVPVDSELVLLNELAQRLLLPNRRVAVDKVHNLGFHDEEASIDDVAIREVLLSKRGDARSFRGEVQHAEAARQLDCRDGRERALLPVKRDEIRDIHVAHAVAIGQTKCRVVEIIADALEASASHRLLAGIDKRYPPRIARAAVGLDRVIAQIDREIAVTVEEIEEVVLDRVALVTAADHEIVQSMMRIQFHDVPEDRLSADLDKRLRHDSRFFAQPRPVPASKNHDFHGQFLSGGINVFLRRGTNLTNVK